MNHSADIRLLYVCGSYAPEAFSGSELSAHTLLKHWSKEEGRSALVVTDTKYTQNRGGKAIYDGVPIYGIDHESRIKALDSTISEFNPTVIITQLLWSDIALAAARKHSVPSIIRICDRSVALDLSNNSMYHPTNIIAISQDIRKYIEKQWRRESTVLIPAIDLKDVVFDRTSRKQFITLFNPIKEKGGFIFRELALAMPDRKFAVIPGWSSLRGKDGRFDRQLIARHLESKGSKSVTWYPSEAFFDDLKNVTMLEPRPKVSEIYAQTRILCMPSLWSEPFGRVSIEALANGIPVIAHPVGALKEVLHKTGVLLNRVGDIEEWKSSIEALDDNNVYAELSRAGRIHIEENYSLISVVSEFHQIVMDTIQA